MAVVSVCLSGHIQLINAFVTHLVLIEDKGSKMSQAGRLDCAQAFVEKALDLARNVFQQDLISVYVFGGVARGEFCTKTSDVDLLFIVSDECPNETIDRFEGKMEKLEIKQGILPTESVDLLYYAFAYKTLFFKSHFTLRLSGLKSLDFHAMFSEGKSFKLAFWKILSRVVFPLAPTRLIIRNMLKGAKLLTGQDLLSQKVLPQTTRSETIKIFIMSWLISIFGIVSSVFSRSSTRFSLGAMKWYLLNVYSIYHGETTTVDRSLRFALTNHFLPESFVTYRFIKLRGECSYDLFFNAILPFYLIASHFRLTRHLRKQAHNGITINAG